MNHDKHQLQLNRFCDFLTKPVFSLGLLAAIIISYFLIDKPLALFMHSINTNPLIDNIALFFTYFGYGGPWIVLFAIAFLFFRYINKNARLANQMFFLGITILVAGAFCDIIKMFVGRARPIELFTVAKYGFYFFQHQANMWSFPSGHATVISAVMFGLSFLFPRYWRVFMLMIVLTSFSRIVLTKHYLSDVLAGAYLGAMVSIYLYQFLYRIGFIAANKKLTVAANT